MNFLGNITIGQYVPGDSFLHKLDPRSKIIFNLVMITVVFLVNDLFQYALIGAITVTVMILSKVPITYYLKGLKALWILIALTAVFQIFSGGGRVIASFWFFKITEVALYNTIFITLRLVFIILIASTLTLTTSPIRLADGLEALMNTVRVPREWSHDFSMMISIAFRFIPVLAVEADHVMKAQLSRGARFDKGGLIQRMKSLVPLIIPLFVGAVRMADELAVAMEARCYRGVEGRTKYKQLVLKKGDYFFMLASLALIGTVFVHL